MQPILLNAPMSTAFLIPPAPGQSRTLLVDMQGDRATLGESLRARGHDPRDVAALLVTHHHVDHLHLAEAAALARAGTEVFIGRASWDELRERIARMPAFHDLAPHAAALEAGGRLNLLDPQGTRTLLGRQVQWATFPHGTADENHVNLAYRIDDLAISGDSATANFLDLENPAARELFGLDDGSKVRWLALNIAQFSREDIGALNLPAHRKANYLKNHGILEDLLERLANPALRPFFSCLGCLVIHHVRREPITVSAARMCAAVETAARAQGFSFAVTTGAGLPSVRRG